MRLAFGVFADETADGVQVANTEVRGVVLQNHDDPVVVVILVLWVRLAHLIVGDNAGESEKTVGSVLERSISLVG